MVADQRSRHEIAEDLLGWEVPVDSITGLRDQRAMCNLPETLAHVTHPDHRHRLDVRKMLAMLSGKIRKEARLNGRQTNSHLSNLKEEQFQTVVRILAESDVPLANPSENPFRQE